MSLAALDRKSARVSQSVYVDVPFAESGMWCAFHALIDEVFDRKYFTNNGPLSQRFVNEICFTPLMSKENVKGKGI